MLQTYRIIITPENIKKSTNTVVLNLKLEFKYSTIPSSIQVLHFSRVTPFALNSPTV